MPKTSSFEHHPEQYENWFAKHVYVYQAELRAVAALIPKSGMGLEIGVGTGRFAAPFGVRFGVEPSNRMRELAEKRGITTIAGVAEELPIKDSSFDFALMVTTICFVDDAAKALQEAYRVLKRGGLLLVGLIDRNSPIGQVYLQHQQESVFYKEAVFFSVDEVLDFMQRVGFKDFAFRQTIFRALPETGENEPVRPGYGEGSFVVIRGVKD